MPAAQQSSRSAFVVLEGIDGSGKSTQVELLTNYLTAQGREHRFIHFPRLETPPFGPLVAAFLRGDYGALQEVHPQLVALLYAQDRHDFASTLRDWLAEGNLVLADRYVYSNVAFQCAKCSDASERAALRHWILDLEFRYFAIPQPDISLYLDLSSSSASGAMTGDSGRDKRAYLAGGQDIHEADSDFQESVRKEYLQLVQTAQNFRQIACNDSSGNRLSPETVHQQVVQTLRDAGILE